MAQERSVDYCVSLKDAIKVIAKKLRLKLSTTEPTICFVPNISDCSDAVNVAKMLGENWKIA